MGDGGRIFNSGKFYRFQGFSSFRFSRFLSFSVFENRIFGKDAKYSITIYDYKNTDYGYRVLVTGVEYV